MNEERIAKILPTPALLIAGLALLTMLGLAAWAWPQLPADARIAVHFAADGSVNRYGGKFEGLLGIPLITFGLLLLFMALPWIEPRHRHLAQSRVAYGWIVATLALVMAVLHAVMVANALGGAVPMVTVVNLTLGLLFLIMGNFLGKVRSNFFLGIRTPWTLSSELSWARTHRLAGKLMMLAGLGLIAASFLVPPAWMGPTLIGLMLMAFLVPVIYSWWVWRSDPARIRHGAEG